MKKGYLTLLLLLCASFIYAKQKPLDYVTTLMGTESTYKFSHGNTYPAVAVPWGMNFWSPQTGENGSGWMYGYADSEIRGFRQTHQPSPWINDYGTFSLMPISGDLKILDKDRGVSFSHENEIAKPHFYQVKMDNGVSTAVSATSRGAVFEIEYPADKSQYLVVDGYNGGSSLKIDSKTNTVTGHVNNNHGGVPSNFANYFVIKFDQPIVANGSFVKDKQNCAYVKFNLKAGEKLTARVASSFISLEQAELNFKNEVASKSLNQVKVEAAKTWNELLGRISVEGGSNEQMKTFYSCLYRVLLFPREFYEFSNDGNPIYYSPYDGKIHDGYMYTDNGFWDTFRAVHPLFTLVYPEVSERIVPSIINAYKESGFMPEWASPGHRGCMIGNNSISLLTDAWMKGIRSFDPKVALEAMIHQTQAQGPEASVGRNGFAAYDSLGYVPYPEYPEAAAKTLEYAYADWCLARFAEATGNKDVEKKYDAMAMNYKNLFDPSVGFIRAKNAKGEWRTPFDAVEWGGPFTEGSSWHWSFSVMHDVEGLSDLMGGRKALAARLDSMFTAPSTYNVGTYGFVIHEIAEMVALNMGQYAHGNQPIQHAIYLYNYAGQPWKAQYHLRDVMNKLYNSGSKGYCGDEDNGQTSAWYVFSAMGFYPVCPGQPEYVMGSPLFNKITISLPNNKSFVINAAGNSDDNLYIDSAKLNGRRFNRNYLTHKQIVKGGKLNLKMSSEPNTKRGTRKSAFPYSVSK